MCVFTQVQLSQHLEDLQLMGGTRGCTCRVPRQRLTVVNNFLLAEARQPLLPLAVERVPTLL